ncbi:MAG: phosphoribosylamine--glycine ligase [Salinarimonadaceae bacterium]|nr:MAG: phosphoribosylamine--glycine ligase [Salinarimonadaceae bacterium]
MDILLIGSGGREHALAWGLAASPLCETLHCAPGNPGTGSVGRNVDLDISDHAAVRAFCKEKNIGLVVVGPEAPLVAGLVDDLRAGGFACFGPTKRAARLEGSKGFTKDICARYGIPTAAYAVFKTVEPALAYVREKGAPIVIKADGLAAGKGVIVAMTMKEAEDAVAFMFEGGLGPAGSQVVIEEFLDGEEASFFAICDGENALPLASAQDHKRAFDGDTGPNTGGMGAYSPAPVMTPAIEARVMREIIEPTMRAMREAGAPYTGVLYAGLMITAQGPKLIEYNARFGDPEAQVLVPRLKSDLAKLLLAAARRQLAGATVEWRAETALTIVMAARGYPGQFAKGEEIGGVDEAGAREDVFVFHAGTKRLGRRLLSNGGRVLAVTALGRDIAQAQSRAYEAILAIDWPGGFCRSDIGWRALERNDG